MLDNLVEYTFSESNDETLIFVPGYSDGLEVSTIKNLIDYFVNQGGYNVFGINLDYHNDAPDVFDTSQKKLIESVNNIASKTRDTKITLLAKSLGGSISLFNYQKLPISKLVILGCSVVLGWPQRISLLQSSSPAVPDYKDEWNEKLNTINIPTLILSGELDDLSDNNYLSEMADNNKNLSLVVIKNANHNLEDTKTGQQKALDYLGIIVE